MVKRNNNKQASYKKKLANPETAIVTNIRFLYVNFDLQLR